MRILLVCSLAVALAVLAPGGRAAHKAGGALHGTVGPGFTIQLVDASGARVTHLDPGNYTVQVDDLSPGHNFHVFGPGVDLATDVLGTGSATWNVTFTDGSYAFVCDPHVGEMSGGFTVGNAATTTSAGSSGSGGSPARANTSTPAAQQTTASTNTPNAPTVRRASTTTAPSVIRATLTSTNLTITPVVVKAGDFAFVVRDLSHARGFWLAGSGVTRHTSRTRVGTIRWPITLAPGRYSYGVNGRPVGTLTVDP